MFLILLHLLLLGWLSWQGYRRFINSPIRLYYFPALGLKLACGIVLGLLYLLYYEGGDTLNYHHDAAELAGLAVEDPPGYLKVMVGGEVEDLTLIYAAEERALLTAKIFSIFYLFTASNYWITACYVSFLSFLILYHLAHRLVMYERDMQKPVVTAFLFWPSFVFWTSGLLKESLAMICMGFIISAVLPYLLAGKKMSWLEIVVAVPLLLLLLELKYYYAGLLAPVLLSLLAAFYLGRYLKLKKPLVWGVFIAFLAGGILLATQLHPNLYVDRFLAVWVENYYLLSAMSEEGAYVVYENLQASWKSILQNAPKAIFAGLFAPLVPHDFTNSLRMAAAAENILLLLLSIIGMGGWLFYKKGRLTLPAFAVLLYVIVFALVMGIAAPNYGTLSRYRISYQPFFVLLILTGCQNLISRLRLQKEKTP